MTAPSAPVIVAHSDGDKVYVRWGAVAGAASYKLYADETAAPTLLNQTITPADTAAPQQAVIGGGPASVYVRLTALNGGAEESGYSNEVRVVQVDSGRRFTPGYPDRTFG